MKTRLLVLIAILALIATSACNVVANIGNGVRPSGTTITEERQVSDFDSVSLSGAGDLIIEQGDTEGLTIETDDNLMQHITSEVRSGRLELGYEDGIRILGLNKVVFHLKVKDLTSIDISGLGKVTMDGLQASSLDLNASGSGQFNIKNIQTTNLVANAGGFGLFNLSGEADTATVNISGSGNFDGGDLKTQNTTVNINGAGNATLWAEDTLNVMISGGGLVRYYGSPEVTQSISGAGSINQAGDK